MVQVQLASDIVKRTFKVVNIYADDSPHMVEHYQYTGAQQLSMDKCTNDRKPLSDDINWLRAMTRRLDGC